MWLHELAYFFGGAFCVNGVPHFVSGVTGRRFQTPFARPPGKGLSSATVNLLWGFANLAAGYELVSQIGSFTPRSLDSISAGAGALGMGLVLARLFGPLHGGDAPRDAAR